jgi:hypothetical protein
MNDGAGQGATEEEKPQFRRKTAKIEVMKIIETINIVDRLQQPVGAQLVFEKLGRRILKFNLLFDGGE